MGFNGGLKFNALIQGFSDFITIIKKNEFFSNVRTNIQPELLLSIGNFTSTPNPPFIKFQQFNNVQKGWINGYTNAGVGKIGKSTNDDPPNFITTRKKSKMKNFIDADNLAKVYIIIINMDQCNAIDVEKVGYWIS